MNFTFTTPVAAQFPGDTPITGVTVSGVMLDFDAGTCTVLVTPIGGRGGPGASRRIVLTPPAGEMSTLLAQLKAAVASALGVTFSN